MITIDTIPLPVQLLEARNVSVTHVRFYAGLVRLAINGGHGDGWFEAGQIDVARAGGISGNCAKTADWLKSKGLIDWQQGEMKRDNALGATSRINRYRLPYLDLEATNGDE